MDLEKINDFIKDRHYPMIALAKELGMSKQSLYYKLSGKRDFRAKEIYKLAEIMRMTDPEIIAVFFDRQMDK